MKPVFSFCLGAPSSSLAAAAVSVATNAPHSLDQRHSARTVFTLDLAAVLA